ncbi:MAG TPA: MaoC family dehydratase [Afifellaceae bacterium]|nr:MaoC family dehydratase [Afifellaceae bacterium]
MSYFEDLKVGQRTEIGSYTFTTENIKRFARAFDPQPFHLDEEAARASSFGGLCASGWQTASVWMRLLVDHRARNADRNTPDSEQSKLGPSPGFDDMKWIKPVYAGQTITYSTTVTALRESRSKPQWGIMTILNEGRDENDELVFSFIGHAFVKRRPQAAKAR